jgi:phosphohistidine phosphatase
MDLLIVRHAIAGDRDEWAQSGRPDAERPLTPEGRKRMRESVRGIHALVPQLDLLATSPLTRAAQTAELLVEEYGDLTVVDLPSLAHGSAPDEIRGWLGQRAEERIALVGHEPDLGILICWFVTGGSGAPIPLKKGGAALLRFADAPGPGRAELRWLAPPKLLRLIESE